jgi:TolB-like protein/cytochrome c-type biogenesis protein CcmH/NrfG
MALSQVKEWPLSSAGASASVAVLPFADTSPDRNQEYFADGVTEEIIHSLARLPDLRVVARTSAFAFKGEGADVRAIGEQLGVRNVVEGSVRRSGDRLRVTAQLVSVANGHRLWSETYERRVADVLAIQEAVATRVAEALSVRIGDRSLAQAPPRDARAYELYLAGRQLLARRSEESTRRAIEHFERALVLAPSYAPVLAGLADALTQLTVHGFDTSPDVIEQAREAAQAAIRADPSLGEAHASLGRQLFAGGAWDWDEADRHLTRALELSPGYAPAHLWRGQVLMARGRVREGAAEIEGALELDPFSPEALSTAGRSAFYLGDHEQAIELLRRAVDLSPHSARVQWYLRDAYAVAGHEQEAAETLLAAAPPAAQAELRGVYDGGGLNALLRRFLRLEQERSGELCTSLAGAGASLYAQLGDAEGAFHCLRLAARAGEMVPTELDPLFAPYRSDARHVAYLEAINLRE